MFANDTEEPFVLSEAQAMPEVEQADDYVPDRNRSWVLPSLAILAALGSFAGLGWLVLPTVQAGMAPVALVQLIAALCVPPLLIGLLYLLAMRTSRAEARRFGATAHTMRQEAASLDRTIEAISHKITANRTALAEQTDILIAMGDRAAAQIAEVAGTVAHQSGALDDSSRTLTLAAGEAERRIAVVLSSLPKAHEEMRGLSERVDAAGLLASERAASLDTQLTALSERGRDADQIAGGAADRLAAHIARMEATSETASARLEAVTGQMSAEVDGVLDRAAAAVDEARKGIAAQGEAILAMLSANQAALDRASMDTTEALSERMATIEDAIGRVGARLGEEQGRSDALFSGLSTGVDRLDRELQVMHAAGMDRTQGLAASVSALHASVDAMGVAMDSGDAIARRVIVTSEELLTALDASAREI
ncbi:MAG: hypothetical protein V4808_14040, partial [Pseudomonadota bacterium]